MSTLRAIEPLVTSAIIALLTAGVVKIISRHLSRDTPNLPPGPKPLPIIGNLFDIPKEKEWLDYRAMTETYGDVVYLESLGQKLVILGSLSAIRDLMDRRGAVYSHRFIPLMCRELMGFSWPLTTQSYGPQWRHGRKVLHTHFNEGTCNTYHSVQLSAARRLAKSLLDADPSPDVLFNLVRDNVGQTIVKVMYGIDVKDSESEFISRPEKIVRAFAEAVIPGRFLVDFIPFLKHVPVWAPGAEFRRYAEDVALDSRLMRDKPIEVVQAGMADGSAPFSVARAMLENDAALPAEQSDVETIKNLAGLVYAAAADTTVSALLSFFLAILVYPDVQAKGQEEIDRVVGKDRLPTLEDMERLPYVQAIVKECWRWIPVIPMGLPHATARDDEYKGYFIPKGTLVLGSAWSILHDPEAYPEPETFKPERFLHPDNTLNPSVRDPRIAAFGFGRRICPGRYFAEATQFATIATVLATMDVVRAKGVDGQEIIPDVDVHSATFCYPKPFNWAARSRSARSITLLESALGIDS